MRLILFRWYSRQALLMYVLHLPAWWHACRSTATRTSPLHLWPGLASLVETHFSTLSSAPMLSSSRGNRQIGKTMFSSTSSPWAPTLSQRVWVQDVPSTQGSSWTTLGGSCWTGLNQAGLRLERWWAGSTGTLAWPPPPSSPSLRPWLPTRKSWPTMSPHRCLYLSSPRCVWAHFLRRKSLDLNMESVLTEDLIVSHLLPPPIYQSMAREREAEKKPGTKKLWSSNWTTGGLQQLRKRQTNFLEGPKAKMETGNKTLKSLKN